MTHSFPTRRSSDLSGPVEATLWEQAYALGGGDKAWLIIDDAALPKKGTASVGVAPQYASALGKNANCQTLVSVTLASREVPIMLGLRRSEEHTSELQSLMRISYAVFCLKKKIIKK